MNNNTTGMIRIPSGQPPIGAAMMPRESAAPGAEHHMNRQQFQPKAQATGTLPQDPVPFFKNPRMNTWKVFEITLTTEAEERFKTRGLPYKITAFGLNWEDAINRIIHIIRKDEIEDIHSTGDVIYLPNIPGLEVVPNGQQTRF